MKKLFKRKKKSASEVGSIGSGLSGSAYNISPKKDLGKLHRAAFEGDLIKLRSLLKRGDVNQLDKENRTPLHLACANGKYEVVQMLCDHPNIKLNLCDNERKSALMKCVQCEHLTCMKILLDKEADVSLCDINGNTTLHIASSIPNSDICYLLSDYNADPKAKNKDGATALHIAASLGSDEIVKFLLGSGVDINDVDDNKKTPLMHAAHKGHLTTTELLLSKNADTSIRDLSGWTADEYASMDGFHAISHIIVEHNTKRALGSTPSRQSTISRTPLTTPQKLGLQGGSTPLRIGGPDMGSEDDSSSDESPSTSGLTNEKDDSWASSNSENEEPKYARVEKKKSVTTPKINIMQALNFRKKSSDVTSPIVTSNTTNPNASQPMQSPSKTTTNLFLTTSAREQLKKQESEEGDDTVDSEHRGMRSRYESKSARGEPVSPAKPPLPASRTTVPVDRTAAQGTKPVPEKLSDADSDWDSSEDEETGVKATTHAAEGPDKKLLSKPNEKMMRKLGFDESEMKRIYGDDDSNVDTDTSHSEAAPVAVTALPRTKKTSSPTKPPAVKQKADTEDSWDDDSFSEKNESPSKKGGSFLHKATDLKFDDETDSEAEVVKPTTAVKPNQLLRNLDVDDDDSTSWNSDDLVKRPEDAPTEHAYVSSSTTVLKDAEKLVSPQHKLALQQKIAEREQKVGLGITYGVEQSNDEDSESEIESESSWEQENQVRKAQVLNNQRDIEKERKKTEEEQMRVRQEDEKTRLAEERRMREEEEKRRLEVEKRVKEDEEKRRLEEKRREEAKLEEKKKKEELHKQLEEKRKEDERIQEELRRKRKAEQQKQLEEETRRRVEEEKQKRDLEQLEELNRMNQELEKKNAELKRKAQEEERLKLEATKTAPMNESLRMALERAAEVTSESGDSNPESSPKDEQEPRQVAAGPGQADYLAESPPVQSAPAPISRSNNQQRSSFKIDGNMDQVDLDTLTEETETDDDLSLSEGHPPIIHTSPLSESLKLAEDKQNLSLRLAREQDVASSAQEKLESIQKENKQLRLRERILTEEKKTWELEKVEMNADNRKLTFEVKNLGESLETINLKLTKHDERSKRMEEQLQVEREERREQEVLVRDLRIDLKNANAAVKQAELDCEELKEKLAADRESRTLAQTMKEDSFKINETLQSEAMKDDKVESLERVVQEKNQDLIKVRAERDRYEDASARYKEELAKIRSHDADQHGNLFQINQDLNDKLDEKEDELRESEEALQLTALQSLQFKQAYENANRQLAENKRENESIIRDLEMLNNQQAQLKKDLDDSRSCHLREQERMRKMEDSQEKMREKEATLQEKLLSAEKKASRLENELQNAELSNKQRAEDTAKWENEYEKVQEASRDNKKNISKMERELAEQSGKIEALKIELHQRESECVQMRQEKEDMRSRNATSATEQQEKFNSKLTAIQREHENERVALETRNVQLAQQSEHWKSEVDRIEKEKARKDEELSQAQQDRIEVHKKLGYADAFSKSASKEQKQLMDENMKFKEDSIRLQSQVSLLEQKVEEKSSTIADLQKEVDRFYQTSSNANRKIDSLSESQRLAENGRLKLEQQLKDIELENIRLKSELDSANSWKERLQESREEDAHSKAALEEKVSKLECDKVLAEEKLAAEIANAKIFHSEAEGHKSMWEGEVKSRSKLEVELSKAGKDVEDERTKAESLRNKLTRAVEERKAFKTKYEKVKREKIEAERRAESYSSDEAKRVQFENEKLKEELRRLRAHVEASYVDRSELEAARQEERIKAQAVLAPTLDQVNSFLKDRQMAQDVLDQLRSKNEEHRHVQTAMTIVALEEEVKSLKRRNEDSTSRRFHQQGTEISQLYDSSRRENEVLQQQLSRANNKADEYKANWIKERKKFQTFFSSTLGGSLPVDSNNMSAVNGLPFSPSKLATSLPLGGAFSSTPKKDPSDPILTQLRGKLDASIAQHLSPMPHSAPNMNGHLSSGSSSGTPRSDHSHHHEIPGTSGHKSTPNEYMSFLLT